MIPVRCFGPGALGSALPHQGFEGPCPRTALRVGLSGPRHFEAHLARLQAGALFLGNHPHWLEAAGRELQGWLGAKGFKRERALRLRLYLDRQVLVAEMEPLPRLVSLYLLVPMEHPMSARRTDPITRHKGLCGPWSSQTLVLAHRLHGQDALLAWPDGTLAETAIATVGLEIEGTLLLPPALGRVASLTEALDLPAWAADRGFRIQREPIPMARIKVGRIWCMNALRGIWPATLA